MAEAQKRASFAVEDMVAGGGNLWGTAGAVRAKVVGGRFTKEAPDNYTAEGNPIFGVADFELAGDAPIEDRKVNQSFSLGATSGDNFTISEDGDYLIPTSDDAHIVKDSKFGIFASSLQNEGVPKTIMADFGFSRIAGLDGDWKRIADKERNFVNDTKKKSKFPPSTLCLVKLQAMPGEHAKTAGVATAATPLSPSATTAASSAGPSDLDGDTWLSLETALKAAGGSLQRGKLTLAVSKAAGSENPNRQAMARRAMEEPFILSLVEAGVLKYAAADKGQPVSLA